MHTFQKITGTLLTITLLAPNIAYARPSFRSIRTDGKDQINNSKQVKLKSMKEGLKTVYERIEHPRGNGLSGEIPEEWELYLPTKDDGWSLYADDMAVYFTDLKIGISIIGFGKKTLDHPATLEDADSAYTKDVRQPTNDYELLHLPFLHDYKHISTETVTIHGAEARQHTYTYIGQSVHWKERDIRLPMGNALVVIIFRDPMDTFDKDLPHFEQFISTLLLGKKPQTTKSSASSSKKRKAALKKPLKKTYSPR